MLFTVSKFCVYLMSSRDHNNIHKLHSNHEIATALGFSGAQWRLATYEWCILNCPANGIHIYTFYDKHTEEFIGYVKVNENTRIPTVSYAVVPTHQRKGYATVMVKSILELLSTAQVNISKFNRPSIKVAEKCGLKLLGDTTGNTVTYVYSKEV